MLMESQQRFKCVEHSAEDPALVASLANDRRVRATFFLLVNLRTGNGNLEA
jgi:hypothetical protein